MWCVCVVCVCVCVCVCVRERERERERERQMDRWIDGQIEIGSQINPQDRYCCLLLAKRHSNMLVYLRNGSAQTIVPAATLTKKLQIKLSISPSHSILTLGQPVPALTLQRQASGMVTTGVPTFKSLA